MMSLLIIDCPWSCSWLARLRDHDHDRRQTGGVESLLELCFVAVCDGDACDRCLVHVARLSPCFMVVVVRLMVW